MCKAAPGPRCASHAGQKLNKAYEELNALPRMVAPVSSGTDEKIREDRKQALKKVHEATCEYDATSTGIKKLTERIKDLPKESEWQKPVLEERLSNGIARREAREQALAQNNPALVPPIPKMNRWETGRTLLAEAHEYAKEKLLERRSKASEDHLAVMKNLKDQRTVEQVLYIKDYSSRRNVDLPGEPWKDRAKQRLDQLDALPEEDKKRLSGVIRKRIAEEALREQGTEKYGTRKKRNWVSALLTSEDTRLILPPKPNESTVSEKETEGFDVIKF